MAGAFAPAIFSCPQGAMMTLRLKSLNYRDSDVPLKFLVVKTVTYLASRDCRRHSAVKGDYFSFLARTALLFAPTHP
jgi:hypothetical protein